MSKINAVRLININYNNNAIRISDETFHFNGESTLMSLRNGGGKSVLVQMLTAPFVHKRYRDAKDRPFESYFTTNKPSFIMTEWALDKGAGYVLAGMMVRKAADSEETAAESLEMVNFISEYPSACLHDIHHLPVLEKRKREIVLKNFASCRQLFEEYKKDSSMKFFYYEMSNTAQSRQYFDKLQEYQINYKEWEGIIKKVNLKESGLSDLFADCRDEKGLVEKWFLDAVENKLNKDKNRMKEFQMILEKYVGQYKENQSKIKRRDRIRQFRQEALRIEEKNRQYLENEQGVREQENRIACFRSELEELHQRTADQEQENRSKMEELRAELAQLEYQKLSEEYYQLEEKKSFHAGNREMIAMEKEDLEREAERMQQKLYVLACAKQQDSVEEEKADWELARQRLLVARERKKDLEPERNCLGYLLRSHYQSALAKNQDSCKENRDNYAKITENIRQEQQVLMDLEESLRQNALHMGELKTKIAAYDRQEEQFNGRYQEQLTRNILGEYEPGSLEVFGEVLKKMLADTARQKTLQNRELEKRKTQDMSLEHKLAGQREERTRALTSREQHLQLQESYEKELEQRRFILKYLELEESALFEEEKIFQTADHKLREIEILRRNLEREENELQKEYQRLTEGRVLELPPELSEEFERQGIHTVYGMEWLKKNGYSRKKNQELVQKHPFLPYALILSEGEMKKLSEFSGAVPTAFPIPIILRKDLEQKDGGGEGNVIQFPRLSFYLLFNENLLDEEKLAILVNKKQRQIEKKQEMTAVRKQEYSEYFAWKEQIKNQNVCKEKYQKNQAELLQLTETISKLEEDIRSGSQELVKNREQTAKIEKEIRKLDLRFEQFQRKQAEFEELQTAYAEYKENRRMQEKCRKEELRFLENQKISRFKTMKLQEILESLQNSRVILERDQEQLKKQLALYQGYKKIPEREMKKALPETIRKRLAENRETMQEDDKEEEQIKGRQAYLLELEARYAAVTATVSQEIQELEHTEQRSAGRYRQAQEELAHLSEKYHLSGRDWLETNYSRKEENDVEIRLQDRRMKIKGKESLWNQENIQVALYHQQLQDRMRQMKEAWGKEEPLPREEIPREDFESRKHQLDYQYQELGKIEKTLQDQLHNYDENLTALAEYSEFKREQAVAWEEDFSLMDTQALRKFKGILLRDYNRLCSDRGKARENLLHVLNQIVRMESFQEDFYRKPLEAMLELSGDARSVQRQLETTLQSYENLMEKLEVDISLVEKEKNKIVELLGDYLKEVHQNLGKIDQNSTITIRERPVKMLKIQLPSWEENESIYHIRLQDFIDELTRKGLAIFQRNENAQEYFGTQMTTKNLYDTVVGISNVQIRLYKIEEQREYPITWAEVARNSGGEGFLSAFVVLSSLLYFMRRDDSDIFADRNEGKVLLMDNPFAQTNAAHLLKPLMDMAKKTNTQLICFTGLGGESIYSRFDNIYVLNLIAASLRQGMQYLRADHMRGNEPITMISAQVEVVKQQELIF
ncbi:hypothetical protein AALA98_00845 [Lachnospiraceae bacterium 45-W7]